MRRTRIPLGVHPKLHLKRTFQRCAAAWGLLLSSYLWFVPLTFPAWQSLGVTPHESRNLATVAALVLIFLITSAGVQVGDCWIDYAQHGQVKPRPQSVRRRR